VCVLLALVQAVAVRLAGFQTLALALKILYLVMTYIATYPIAMSVCATNVYEERSLGVFEDEDEDDAGIENEVDYPASDSRVAIWGRYLGRHVRHQLSYDLWWLMFAVFLLAVTERGSLRSADNGAWFNLFTLIFEAVSAYTTVGLSLGIPTANSSLAGAFSPLGKLVVCAAMLRGLHRGLPVKVDRAILLPTEFAQVARACVHALRGGAPAAVVEEGGGEKAV